MHYYLVEWHVLVAGYGHAEEHEGQFTVLASTAQDALDQVNKEVDRRYPKLSSKTVSVAPTLGY